MLDAESAALGSGLFVIAAGGTKDEGGGANGDDGAIGDTQAFVHLEESESYKGACAVGAGIAQGVEEVSLAVLADVDDAVGGIHAGVVRLDRQIGMGAVDVASDDVVAQLQGQFLAVVEYVFHDDDVSVVLLLFFFLRRWCSLSFLVLAGGHQFGHSDTYAELAMTIRALEDECLSVRIAGFVEGDVLVTLGATYSFHNAMTQVDAYSRLV